MSEFIDKENQKHAQNNKHTKERKFKLGDRVFISAPTQPDRPKKLQPITSGPYQVIGFNGNAIVIVQRLSDLKVFESHLNNTILVNERALTTKDHPNVNKAFPIHDINATNQKHIDIDSDDEDIDYHRFSNPQVVCPQTPGDGDGHSAEDIGGARSKVQLHQLLVLLQICCYRW